MVEANLEIPNLDAYQKKVIDSKLCSKIIWGSAFSGKTWTLCLRANVLLEKKITPLILCFSTHHRRLIRVYLSKLNIKDKVKVLTFKEWMLKHLTQNDNGIASYTHVINREESLLWLKKHQNQWSGNDDPNSDLEIIWTEKIFSPKGQPSDYQDLVKHYQEYLEKNHLIDEIDLCFMFDRMIPEINQKDEYYFLIDEVQEATVLEIQLLSKLLQKNIAEIFADYNQGVMAWRTPLPPITLKEFKKYLKVKKYYYLKNNYFNAKAIINLGSKLIRKNKNRISKRIKTISPKKGECHFYLFETPEEEGRYIADAIHQSLGDPLHQEDHIGILVRNHQQAYELASYLESVLTSPYYANSFMRQPSAQKLVALMRLLLNLGNDTDYDILKNAWSNTNAKDQYFAFKNDIEKYQLYFSNIVKNPFLKTYLEGKFQEFILIQKIFSPTGKIDIYSLEKWHENSLIASGEVILERMEDDQVATSFTQAGESLWQELVEGKIYGYYRGFYASTCLNIPNILLMEKNSFLNSEEDNLPVYEKIKPILNTLVTHKDFLMQEWVFLNNLRSQWQQFDLTRLLDLKKFENLFDSADCFGDLHKLNEIYLSLFLQHLSPLKNWERFANLHRSFDQYNLQNQARVTLCTIHEGRHLQFQKVFVPRLHQFEFPHAESCAGTKLEEERRLLFVAFMRSEQAVILSCNKKGQHISSFIRDIGKI